jgi:hypothetical protein
MLDLLFVISSVEIVFILIILGIFLFSQDAFDIVKKINHIYMIIKSNL